MSVLSREVRAVRRSAEFKAGGKESEQNTSTEVGTSLEHPTTTNVAGTWRQLPASASIVGRHKELSTAHLERRS